MTIGYHQLEGKRVELKKPFAVLDRHVAEAAVGGSGSGSEGEPEGRIESKVGCMALSMDALISFG